MNTSEEQIIKGLIKKYNPVLLHSISIALSEDLINLIISNQDDSTFELRKIIKDKEVFKEFVVKEFFKQNSSVKSVINELKLMDELVFNTKDSKLKIKREKGE